MKLLTLAIVAACLVLQPAPVAAVTLTIDPARSFLTITDAVLGGLARPQFPGSDTTQLSGNLVVQLDGGNISFPGGSAVQFLNQSQPVEPLPGGLFPGSAAGNYGLALGNFAVWALRELTADLVMNPAPIFEDGRFWSNSAPVFTGGQIDINRHDLPPDFGGTEGHGSWQFADGTVRVHDFSLASWVSNGNDATVTIPIDFYYDLVGQMWTGQVTTIASYRFSGEIVATGVVPEPSSLVLAAVAGVAGIGLVRRRK